MQKSGVPSTIQTVCKKSGVPNTIQTMQKSGVPSTIQTVCKKVVCQVQSKLYAKKLIKYGQNFIFALKYKAFLL
jgi:hypothetical protein